MNWRSKARDIALCGVMAAMLELGKLALNAIANVEVVTLLVLLFARHFRWRVFPAVLVFVGLECLVWGLGPWSLSYLYIWPLLATLGLVFRKQESPLFWAILAGFFGLCFGLLCAFNSLLTGGFYYAVTWWVSGIPYDLIHGAANFVIALVLWKPLDRLLTRLVSI